MSLFKKRNLTLPELTDQTLDTALAAADRPIMLTTGAQVARAAKAWRRADLLALDTEFVRERTYFAELGLVQISDGQTVWLLDPLAEGTLPPLRELLEDPGITKLFHSPSEDLDVLANTVGALPVPLVDSQLACAMLGQPLQLGYHKAAEWLLGLEVDKDQTRSNWCARPLKPAQLRYAALDVCVLPQMWQILREQLQDKGRLGWLEEDCARVIDAAARPADPSTAWQRIKGAGRLDGQALAILSALAAWREGVARERNRPRGFIIPDGALLTIASRRMTEPEQLIEVESLHPRARQRHQATLNRLVQDVLDSGERLPEIPRATPKQRKRLAALRDAVANKARALDIEPALLASRKELEQLVYEGTQPPLPGRLDGWRADCLDDVLTEFANPVNDEEE
ncbi:ribonuclease D [Marinihelvus fidelis]|uniref:Ribonuclease D n=1 Tax=Marinihelvus fidelis TaxID=2613842 RepID=A0A5N0T676_9GAMM|nr:ribonuclease D [Marinihelvus fidelis]KAA9130555.1 ribonuclease D [Marinihelvus fidelis]